jgi:hypothetical protein
MRLSVSTFKLPMVISYDKKYMAANPEIFTAGPLQKKFSDQEV